MPTRRAFITTIGSAATVGTLSRSVSASHFDAQPEHVTLSYDQPRLEQYRPLLDIDPVDREKLIGLYGWIAESPEYDTDIMCYWASYTHQDPPWYAPSTGHYGDHEPVQVVVDSDSGDVARVRASIYHWIKGTADAVPLDGTNPRLRVINPYHHYTAAASDASVSAFEVKDLTTEYQDWLDNGLEAEMVRGATTNPWIMSREADWWAPGRFGLPSTEQLQAQTAKDIGFGVVGTLEQ